MKNQISGDGQLSKRKKQDVCVKNWYYQGITRGCRREASWRQVGSAAGKQSSSLSVILEVNNLETEHELSCAAKIFLDAQGLDEAVEGRRDGSLEKDRSWKLRHGIKLQDLREQFSAKWKFWTAISSHWHVFIIFENDSMKLLLSTCRVDVKMTLVEHVKETCWKIWTSKH